MTRQVLEGIRISDFPSAVRYVLDKGRGAIRFTTPDPAGFGGQISGLENAKSVAEAVQRFEAAYQTAVSGEQLGTAGRAPEAFAQWQKIFGAYFPSYG